MKMMSLTADAQKQDHGLLNSWTVEERWNDAVAYFQQGEHQECAIACNDILLKLPGHDHAMNLLGLTFLVRGDPENAIRHIRNAAKHNANDAGYFANLGSAYNQLHDTENAMVAYERSLSLEPNHVAASYNLGNLYFHSKNWKSAVDRYQHVLGLQSDHEGALTNMGWAAYYLGDLALAQRTADIQIKSEPSNALAYALRGNVYHDHGELDRAIRDFRRCLALNADLDFVQSNLLFAIPYHPDVSAEEIAEEYHLWDENIQTLNRHKISPHTNLLHSKRRLRIGYLSPDFYDHPMQYFHEPVFANHDKREFELFAYAQQTTAATDGTTKRLEDHFEHFIHINEMTDDELAARIRSDQIDILVDLAGHTNGNRVRCMAQKPAPIQASWWIGSAHTTGLSSIDYFIGNEDLVPFGAERFFGEQEVYRLPHWPYCYRPSERAPTELPEGSAFRTNVITFGSFTRTIRLNEKVVQTWAELLRTVPGSILVLDNKSFLDEGIKVHFTKRFQRYGIRPEQLVLGFSRVHWNMYQSIDIVLDPFPHNAGCTTLESLWMGKPVVTLSGRASEGRIGAMILNGIERSEWVANNEAEYISIAKGLANDLSTLAEWRENCRSHMHRSRLLDEVGFTRELESGYREMWAKYCESKLDEQKPFF